MQRNFSCSICSEEAVYCCLCLPVRSYLCPVCLPLHMAKACGVHPLAPATIPPYVDQTNLGDYFRKAACLSKLKESVDVVSAFLVEEHSRLYESYNAFHTLVAKRLYNAYLEIDEHYNKLENELQEIKRDLANVEEGHEVSPQVKQYLERGIHQSGSFVDIERTLSQTLTGDGCRLNQRSEQRCECADCWEVRTVLLGSWTCACRCLNSGEMRVCAECGAEKETRLGNCESSTCSKCRFMGNSKGNSLCLDCLVVTTSCSTPIGDTWTCVRCGCCNSSLVANCEGCRGVLPGSLPPNVTPCELCEQYCGGTCLTKMYESEPRKNPGTSQFVGWRCRYCREATNVLCDMICFKCGFTSGEVPWLCFGCGEVVPTHQMNCSKCKACKDLSTYLDSRGARLSADKLYWVCKMCKELTLVRMAQCNKCGYVEELVRRALEGKGDSVTWGQRLVKMFSG